MVIIKGAYTQLVLSNVSTSSFERSFEMDEAALPLLSPEQICKDLLGPCFDALKQKGCSLVFSCLRHGEGKEEFWHSVGHVDSFHKSCDLVREVLLGLLNKDVEEIKQSAAPANDEKKNEEFLLQSLRAFLNWHAGAHDHRLELKD